MVLNPHQIKSRCLILGGGGFMGSHLAEELLEKGYRVRVFDRPERDRRNLAAIANQIEICEGDFQNEADLQDVVSDSEVIFHLVGTTLPASSNTNPAYDVESNVIGSIRLLELCARSRPKKIIFSSSGGTVYGVPERSPIDEQHSTHPICSYGISKLAIEKYIQLYARTAGLDYSILRISNCYGERQRLDASQGVVAVFLGSAALRRPIHLWGDGSVVRDFVYVKDVVRAFRLAMEYTGPERIFNVSANEGISISELLRTLTVVTGQSFEIVREAERKFDVPQNILDNRKIQRVLNWNPQVSFEEGLRRTWAWILDQKELPILQDS
ncbi:MAG: NAD-dependent epimerase/dehydratase family protein [Acidobacteriia bacterium]|nr:NAD-dependent epimerase/dehydratase family protein [Terriglobia bacterium]